MRKVCWLFAVVLTVCGMTFFLAGFLYDVLFAGIPYPDPTAEMAARYALHARIAAGVRCGGVCLLLAGAGLAVVGICRRMIRRGK
jgi:hypothetical protein